MSTMLSETQRSASASSSTSSAHPRPAQSDGARHSAADGANDEKKVTGACAACRRSKVKCEHGGTAPCKRCEHGGYECIFKPRDGGAYSHDEWRSKTDETLERLITAIGSLVDHDSTSTSQRKRKYPETAQEDENDNKTSVYLNGSDAIDAFMRNGNQSRRSSLHSRSFQDWIGDHSTSPLKQRRESVINQLSINTRGKREDSAPRLLSTTEVESHQIAAAPHPTLTAIRIRGSLPQCQGPSPPHLARSGKGSVLDRVSRYRYPALDLGQKDPRLDAIRLGLLESKEARALFALYARRFEPLAFGFPDFPASSDLTPVLLSSISSTASLHSPDIVVRRKHLKLRADVLERTTPFFPADFAEAFDPESGIGTEEIIGACIWSSYEGSEDAWKVARAARWWSEKCRYEQGSQNELTVGEIIALLPPVRHVNMLDRVRVWLSAYLCELHQCLIQAQDSIAILLDPEQYGLILRKEALVDPRQELDSPSYENRQDLCLVFSAQVAYLTMKARDELEPTAIKPLLAALTSNFFSGRAALQRCVDQCALEDETMVLHYSLSRAYIQLQLFDRVKSRAASLKDESFSSELEMSNMACHECLVVLTDATTGMGEHLSALPSIFHYWIFASLSFLLQLMAPDSTYCSLGLMSPGRKRRMLGSLGFFLKIYAEQLSMCDTPLLVDEEDDKDLFITVRHSASEGVAALMDMYDNIVATA